MNPAIPMVQDYLIDSAERLPWKEALVTGDHRHSYGELDASSDALASSLVAHGVDAGDRVLVFCENGQPAVVAFWAVLKAGAVVVPVHPQTRSAKLEHLLNDTGATALIADSHLGPVFVEAARRSPLLATIVVAGDAVHDPGSLFGRIVTWTEAVDGHAGTSPPARRGIDGDLAAIMHTSGSTGEPKGVMLTHRNMMSAVESVNAYLRNVEDDVILDVLPLSFNYGLYQMLMAFKVGARLVLEKSFAYPARVLARVVEEGVTAFPGVPTMFAMLSDMPSIGSYDFARVRYVTSAAAAVPPKHIVRAREIFPRASFFSMYGLTECTRCTYLPPEDLASKPSSIGIPIPNTSVWVVDENGAAVPPNKVGQLVVRGPTVMLGYWNKPEETAARLRPGPLAGERVLHTGDYCTMDEDGYVYFVARMDDIIKCRGEKVAPKEIEHVLLAISGVKEAAVVGAPDPLLGQVPVAFVVLEEEARLTAADLRRECQARLESFMVPKVVRVVPSLPRSANGKIEKRTLTAEMRGRT